LELFVAVIYFNLQKNRLTGFFIIKPRHPSGIEKKTYLDESKGALNLIEKIITQLRTWKEKATEGTTMQNEPSNVQ